MKQVNSAEIRMRWDQLAGSYRSQCTLPSQSFLECVPKTGVILDVGCGQGRVSEWCFKNGFDKVIGLDWSSEILKNISKQVLFSRINADCRFMPFKDRVFDASILSAILTTQGFDSNLKLIVEEVHRVLKPGGVLFISDFLIHWNFRNMRRYLLGWIKYRKFGFFDIRKNLTMRHFHVDHLLKLLKNFVLVSVSTQQTKTFQGNDAHGITILAKKRAHLE